MKKTLSGFSNEDISAADGKNQAKQNAQSQTNKNATDIKISKSVAQQYDKIKDLSQSQASAMLQDEVKRQKQNGTFNFENLQRQVSALQGYLPEKDFENLQKLLSTLR